MPHYPGIVWEPVGNELTRNSSGNTWSQSSQLAEPLWTDPGLKSGISVRELIFTLKKKSAGGEWIVEHSPKILAREEKTTTTTKLAIVHIVWERI